MGFTIGFKSEVWVLIVTLKSESWALLGGMGFMMCFKSESRVAVKRLLDQELTARIVDDFKSEVWVLI